MNVELMFLSTAEQPAPTFRRLQRILRTAYLHNKNKRKTQENTLYNTDRKKEEDGNKNGSEEEDAT